MPPFERAEFERVMTLFQNPQADPPAKASALTDDGEAHVEAKLSREIVCNGKTYDSLDELPPDVRKMLENRQGADSDSGVLQATTSENHQEIPIESFTRTTQVIAPGIKEDKFRNGIAWVVALGFLVLLIVITLLP